MLVGIDQTVGGFRRELSAAAPADQLRIVYEVDRHSVIILEQRPPHASGDETWISIPAAKFRPYRRRDQWLLYWMRASGKWDHQEGPRRRLQTLLRYVAADEYGCSFG